MYIGFIFNMNIHFTTVKDRDKLVTDGYIPLLDSLDKIEGGFLYLCFLMVSIMACIFSFGVPGTI